MAHRRHPPFTGILATPIEPPRDDETLGAAQSRWMAERLARMTALAVHYGIDTSLPYEILWHEVTLALAEQFVPGFAMLGKAGRKPTTDGLLRDMELVVLLGRAEKAKKSVSNAARLLAKKRGMKDGKALRERYYLLKKPTSPEGIRLRKFISARRARLQPQAGKIIL